MGEEHIDLFELRMQFKDLLESAMQSHSQVARAGNFALADAHRSHVQSLYECIKEKALEPSSNANRAHLFYVLDHICGANAARSNITSYADLLQNDLKEIFEAVVMPDNDQNAGHLTHMKKIVKSWKRMSIFSSSDLEPLETKLEELMGSATAPSESETKAELLKKIEDCRDVHKREREAGWYKGSAEEEGTSPQSFRQKLKLKEFSEYWEKTTALTEEDSESMKEEQRKLRITKSAFQPFEG
ncbi:hypothetical protein HDU76_003355 [Blyttiomyces sp. JEL0837]|nr:hypothetical protein HDU76_003355 [Blyttiomyces sp. JEL0837]